MSHTNRMTLRGRYVKFAALSLLLLLVTECRSDVSHLFAPPLELAGYHLHGGQPGYPVVLSPPQLPSIYGPLPTPQPVAPIATTEFTLPEIIENRGAKNHVNFIPLSQNYLPPPNYESPKPPPGDESGFSGYYYPQPQLSSSTSTTTTRRPIIVQDPGDGDEDNDLEQPSGYNYHRPPLSTPAPVYLPPGEQPLRLRLHEMRCLDGGYFRANLKLDSFLGAAPIVDTDVEDKRCEAKLTRSHLILDIESTDFDRCGIVSCGDDLCLRLRFPAIRGLRTAGDAILTLHCKTQERSATKTHALKLGVANDVQSRSSGSHAHGGHQNALRTHVELLRRSANGYTRQLESNGAVQLGEELMLRAHILQGDGWNYTRLSDVQLQRIGATGELLHSAQLLTSKGCLNPAMLAVCAHSPSFEPPLGQRLHFKAVMFQGMHSGDALVLSMRITGCLDRDDCQQQSHDCLPNASHLRRRRNAQTTIQDNNTTSEVSHITFRVIVPEINGEMAADPNIELDMGSISGWSKSLALYGTIAFVGLLVILLGFVKLIVSTKSTKIVPIFS